MEFDKHHPIIEDLVLDAGRLDIEVIFTDNLHPETPDVVDTVERKVIINNSSPLVEILPFRVSHEIGHVLDDTPNNVRWASFENYDSNNPHERIANTNGVKILLDEHLNNGGQFNYIDFMKMYGLPAWTEMKVIQQMQKCYK